MFSVHFLLFTLLFIIINSANGRYEPTWDSLDSRPLPQWYDDAKFGIFIHWGVYSVPSFNSEWFWYYWKENHLPDVVDFMRKNYPPNWTYQEFAKDFRAEFFDPVLWAQIFTKSGAKYVVLTTKHHEGYAMWPSKYSYSWNSVDVGPKRDIVGELAEAVTKEGIKFGVYHSLYEWFNPLHQSDKSSNFTKEDFINKKVWPEMLELIKNYKPAIFWSDGDQGCPDTYWKSKEFLAWLYNDSPVKDVVVTNDRWGDGTECKHGDFYNCDRYNNRGSLQHHKWENAMTLDKKSWGYRRNALIEEFYTIEDLISELVSTVSCGGNLLVNVGPTKEGVIAPIFQERLEQMGEWLSINGEAIYNTRPWKVAQNDSLQENVWYTTRGISVYCIVLGWPRNGVLRLGTAWRLFMGSAPQLYLLGNQEILLKWTLYGYKYVEIPLPSKSEIRSNWAYVIKIAAF